VGDTFIELEGECMAASSTADVFIKTSSKTEQSKPV